MSSSAYSPARAVSQRPAHVVGRLLVFAVAFAMAGHALAAPTPPADQDRAAQAEASTGTNVDYPSQTGPEGPHPLLADASSITSLATIDVRPGGNVDYPTQIGPNGPVMSKNFGLAFDGSPRTIRDEVATSSTLNADWPSQISPEGPSARGL